MRPADAIAQVHCLGPGCGKRLFDVDRGALKPGKVLQIKCPTCNTLNEVRGV